MGARKRNTAAKRKEEKLKTYQAVLNNCPTSPRKMRLVTDMIKGMEVNRALDLLKFSSKEASRGVEKLLLSAIANWQAKNEGVRIEESNLYVKEAFVNQGRTLKRLQTAPQGRAYRIRKRSNHVTLVLDSISKEVEVENTSN
jgi:large subunit ribosomal protein L22